MYLVGDIGGTKTALAWATPAGSSFTLAAARTIPSDHDGGLEAMFAAARALSPTPPRAACLGIAGPVFDGRCEATNLPWTLSEAQISEALGCPARLINDLEALGHAVDALPTEGLLTLNPGQPRPGNRALIAAGTGLGEAILFYDGQRHIVSPSEGGHTDFAPRDDLHIALLQRLRGRHHHVSVERLVCGDGLAEIYAHLRHVGVPGDEAVERAFEATPRGEIVSAASATCPRAAAALSTFLDLYGAEAGNLALKAMAVGGVYVGGGIAAKLGEAMASGTFLHAFADKGRFKGLMESMPVHVIRDDRAALLGAARVAASLG